MATAPTIGGNRLRKAPVSLAATLIGLYLGHRFTEADCELAVS